MTGKYLPKTSDRDGSKKSDVELKIACAKIFLNMYESIEDLRLKAVVL